MKFPLLSVLVISLLSACGGSDSNSIPTISVENATGVEKTNIQVSANAQDSDGSITNYVWQQTKGTDAILKPDVNTLTIELPAVVENETLNFQVTVTDDKGGTNSTEFTINVESLTVSTELSGVVGFSDLVGQQHIVWAEIGNKKIETTTNEAGEFSLPISVDDSFADDLVVLYASPDNPNTLVKLASVLPSVSSLQELEEQDGKVSNKEVAALNLSPFSTSQLTLIKQETAELPTDYAEYLQLQEKLDLTHLLQHTTLSSLIWKAEISEDFIHTSEVLAALPEEFTNVVDSFSEPEMYELVQKSIYEIDNGALEFDEHSSLFSKNSQPITEEDIKPTSFLSLYFWDRMDFNDDGTGLHRGFNEFTWIIENGKLVLDFGEGSLHTVSYGGSEEFYPITKMVFTAKLKYNGQLLVYLDEELNHSPEMTRKFTKVIKPLKLLRSPLEALEMDKEYITSIEDIKPETTVYDRYRVSDYLSIKRLTFRSLEGSADQGLVDIKANALNEENEFTIKELKGIWSLTNNIMTITYEQQTVELVLLEHNSKENELVADIKQKAHDKFRYNGISLAPSSEVLPFNYEQLTQSVFVSPHWVPSSGGPIDYRWHEFSADGTAFLVYVTDSNADGTFDMNLDTASVKAGIWRVENGKLEILDHKESGSSFGGGHCFSTDWRPALENDCVAYSKEVWQQITSHESDTNTFEIHYVNYSDYRTSHWWWNGPVEEPLIPNFYGDYIVEYNFAEQRPIELPDSIYTEARTNGYVSSLSSN